jgi:hypothetical protein
MLQAAEISAEVVKTCGCGYGEECVMHCNHELMPEKCPGDNYWKTNGIATAVKERSEPKILHTDYVQQLHYLEHLGPISWHAYDDLKNNNELHILVEQQKQAQARKDADLAIEAAERWKNRTKELIEVYVAEQREPVAYWTVGTDNSGPV